MGLRTWISSRAQSAGQDMADGFRAQLARDPVELALLAAAFIIGIAIGFLMVSDG